MIQKIRFIYKLLFFIFSSCFLVLFAGFLYLIVKNKKYRYRFNSYTTYIVLKSIAKVFGIKVSVTGRKHIKQNENYLVVCNHMGYLDIPVIQSVLKDGFFITHNEIIEKYTWLSVLPKAAGTYFIERRNIKNLRKEIKDTTEILKTGSSLIFFPEGTSTNGSKILPFHVPFFLTAIRAQKKVLPFCINYISINKEPLNIKNRGFVCWTTKDESFSAHFLRLLRNMRSISVNIQILPPLNIKDKTSKELARESEKLIKQNFKVIT